MQTGEIMEPSSAAAITYAISKVPYALSGLFMGMSVMFLRKKQTLKGYGRAASSAIVGAISFGFPIIFGGAAAVYLGRDPNDVNVATALGGLIGTFAVTGIILIVNYLDKTDDKDIVEVAQDLRKAVAASPKPSEPAKKSVRVRAGVKK
jgi:hypothetical protein